MSENENGFDPTKPARTRDGRDVILNSHLTGCVIGDNCPSIRLKLDGRHMWENPSLALINVASPVTNATEAEPSLIFANLRRANITRNVEWSVGNVLSLSFRGNELAGETGEACNVLKKLDREAMGLVGSRATVADAAEELADVIICADLAAMDLGIDLGAAVVAKFNSTSEKRGLATRLEAALRASSAPEPADASGMTPLDHEARAIFRVMWGHQFGGVAAYEDDEAMWKEAAMEVRKVRSSSVSGEQGDGWQPIATAPKDGTVFLALCMEAQTPKSRIAWFETDDRCVTTGKHEKFVYGGPHRWWPTHWRPLLAPPTPRLPKERARGKTRQDTPLSIATVERAKPSRNSSSRT